MDSLNYKGFYHPTTRGGSKIAHHLPELHTLVLLTIVNLKQELLQPSNYINGTRSVSKKWLSKKWV